MALRKQTLANRKNGLKGGVKTPEGKAISRFNARRHSIFTSALTPEDSKDLYGIEDQLIAALRPVGRVEEMLVEKLALTYLRMQRCVRAEAEFHIRTWEEPKIGINTYEWDALKKKRDYGVHATAFRSSSFKDIVDHIDLYDNRLTSQFLKLLHEIERQQRLRAGENVPPPVVGDLTIHADTGVQREVDAALQELDSSAAPDVQLPNKTPSEGIQESQGTVGQDDATQKAI